MPPSIRHEFNNILAALMAEAQILQMDKLTEEQAAGLDRLMAHARRLRDLSRTIGMTAPEPPAE